MESIWILVNRIFAGLRQASFYKHLPILGNIFGLVTMLTTWAWFIKDYDNIQLKWFVLTLLILGTAFSVMTVLSFQMTGIDIHLWTYLESILLPLAMTTANYDLMPIAFWSYLGTIVFSGIIQLGFNNPFIRWKMPTDDPAGKFFSMSIFGRKWKFPRISNGWIRLGILLILGLS